MQSILTFCLLLFIFVLPAQAEVGEFDIRSVVPMSVSQMQALRTIAGSHPEARLLVEGVAEEAAALLDAEPQPLAVIHYEGLVNTDPKRIAAVAKLREMDDVALLMRYWQASGDERAAAALQRFITAWATTYRPTGNDVNENKFLPLFEAYEALRENFPAEERERVDAWVGDMAERHATAVRTSRHFTNRYTKHVRLVALFGLILERDDLLDLARTGIQRFVSESLRPDGSSLDFERRDTLTYHCSSLKPPLELAMLLGEVALYDWESADGGSLRKSVDFVVPYATGEKTHKEWVNSKVGLDHRRGQAGLEKYRPGRLFDPESAGELMTYASFFDPGLMPLALALDDSEAERYPDWRLLVHDAVALVAE
jgi:hypothetical protein